MPGYIASYHVWFTEYTHAALVGQLSWDNCQQQQEELQEL